MSDFFIYQLTWTNNENTSTELNWFELMLVLTFTKPLLTSRDVFVNIWCKRTNTNSLKA